MRWIQKQVFQSKNRFNPHTEKECKSVQKSVKKVTQEKECNTMTDHQFKVENDLQCNQVQEQVCNQFREPTRRWDGSKSKSSRVRIDSTPTLRRSARVCRNSWRRSPKREVQHYGDHPFKVENNLQCNQVQEKVCNSVSEYVCSTESVQEYQTRTVKECTSESLWELFYGEYSWMQSCEYFSLNKKNRRVAEV